MSAEKIEITERADGVVFSVIVAPRASKSEVVGVHDGALKVRIKTAPVEGAANCELIAHLSKFLKVPKSTVKIVSGETSKRKKVQIDTMDKGALEKALDKNNLS